LGRRTVAAAICGALGGILATFLSAAICRTGESAGVHLVALGVWRVFIFTILSTIGAILTELGSPEPKL